jgi:hypothetical protein
VFPRRPSRRLTLVAAVVALAPLALGAVAAPPAAAEPLRAPAAPASAAAASPAPAPATATDPACTVTGGSLTWGVKESFRAYISGTIAKGSWEPIGGATYATPTFGWSGATGEFDPAALAGSVRFAGGVHFTGHDGLLDTTVANPTLQFAGDGTGTLLLDLTNLSMDDALAGNTGNVQTLGQVPLVALDLAAAPLQTDADAVTVTGTAVPTTITAEGYAAFGSYEPGTAFDPATFSFTVACAEPEPTPEAAAVETSEPPPTAGASSVAAEGTDPAAPAWPLWAAVGALVAAAAAAFGLALRRRARVRRDARPSSELAEHRADGPRDGAA